MMAKKSQSGRSMIEILAVLALIGFLSMAVVQGYQYAIFRYRVHQTFNQISVAVAGARTTNLETLNPSDLKKDRDGNTFIPVRYIISDVNFHPTNEYVFITPLHAEVGVYRDPNGIWRVQINYTDKMDFDDCKTLILSPVAETGIGYQDKIYAQEYLRENEAKLKEICDYYTSE